MANGNEKGPVGVTGPFKLERTFHGVREAYLEITERLMNGEVDPKVGAVAGRTLDGYSKNLKVELDIIKTIDKGSTQQARNQAGQILGIAGPEAVQDGTKK